MWISEIPISKHETSNQDTKHTSKTNGIENMVAENDTNEDSNGSCYNDDSIDYTLNARFERI